MCISVKDSYGNIDNLLESCHFYATDVTSVNTGGHAKVRGRVRRVLRHGVENVSSAVSRCQTSLPASDAYLLNDARR